MTLCDFTAIFSFSTQAILLLLLQMCLLRSTISYLCPNRIHFDAVDFSECRSELVIRFFLVFVLAKS